MSACNSEQAAAIVLGYTKASWDNLSGRVRQPLSAFKPWVALTDNERLAAGLLGYTEISWDNDSDNEPQPAVNNKLWIQMTTCANGEDTFGPHRLNYTHSLFEL